MTLKSNISILETYSAKATRASDSKSYHVIKLYEDRQDPELKDCTACSHQVAICSYYQKWSGVKGIQ